MQGGAAAKTSSSSCPASEASVHVTLSQRSVPGEEGSVGRGGGGVGSVQGLAKELEGRVTQVCACMLVACAVHDP